jgi:predicted patatin/cPLA2 family phospholipase
MAKRPTSGDKRTINLALQGGGTHDAFTWGVLDRLLEDEEAMEQLGVASKLDTDLDFLLHLKELGRRTGGRWLDKNFAALNQHSTLDLRKVFL